MEWWQLGIIFLIGLIIGLIIGWMIREYRNAPLMPDDYEDDFEEENKK